jgi:DNA-directed RNA polymerase sigma subunit (sigma70/sigma32)
LTSWARTRSGSIGLIRIGTPLSKDEESQLLESISAGRDAAEERAVDDSHTPAQQTALRRLVKRGRKAEEELLAGTCALVKQRVNDLGFAFDQDELEAAGLEGLVKALREFDMQRGVRFSTYANYWISKMVYAAISHRVPYPDADLRMVIKFRRLQRQGSARPLSTAEVMRHLAIPRTKAQRVIKMSADIAAGTAQIDANQLQAKVSDNGEPWPESEWVIEALREILGAEFTDFWMWTGRVMTLEELGRTHGISKQAMAKRTSRWKRLVEESPHAERMLAWLRAQ